MTGVRPVGLPAVAGLSSFHETNVRTYVRLADRDPGVWFFNLEAANAIAVRLARRLFHLPYHYARMFLEHESTTRTATEHTTILYAGTRRWPGPLPASYSVRATPAGPVQPATGRNPRTLPGRTLHPLHAAGKVDCTRAAFTTHPILFNQQKFSRSTNLCWPPRGSNDPRSPPWPISPPA